MPYPEHLVRTSDFSEAQVLRSRPPSTWVSPKASRIKASQPHFPHFPRFRFRIFHIFHVFCVFALRNLQTLVFSGESDLPHFPHFPCIRIGFESLISKIQPSACIVTGLRWPGLQECPGARAGNCPEDCFYRVYFNVSSLHGQKTRRCFWTISNRDTF